MATKFLNILTKFNIMLFSVTNVVRGHLLPPLVKYRGKSAQLYRHPSEGCIATTMIQVASCLKYIL